MSKKLTLTLPDSIKEKVEADAVKHSVLPQSIIIEILCNFYKVEFVPLAKGVPRKIDTQKVIELVDSGFSDYAISQQLGCHRMTVVKIKKENGIQ